MKLRIASLTLLALCLAVVPAVAQLTYYDNGPINGTTDAWTINSGFTVSDTFTIGGGVNDLSFGGLRLATLFSRLKSRSPRTNSAAPPSSTRPSTSRRAVAWPTRPASTFAPRTAGSVMWT
jgi:hypothetical protein